MKKAVTEICKEVEINSKMDHPNIVKYYAWFVENGYLYILMEYVDGSSLADFLTSISEKKRKLSEDRLWRIFIQLCMAMTYMHKEKRVVHRDLTCSNVMIHKDDVVKIADFGLARQQSNNSLVMKSVVGTITFSCPEIVMHQEYTHKADIWSLGCILYQMAMLRPPFSGSNPLTLAQKIVEGDMDPMSDDYSPFLGKVVRKLLSIKPDDRPDIAQVSSLIAPLLMAELNRAAITTAAMTAKWEAEKTARLRGEAEFNREKQALKQALHAAEEGNNMGPAGSVPGGQLSSDDENKAVESDGDDPQPPSAISNSSSRHSRTHSALLSRRNSRRSSTSSASLLTMLHKLVYTEQLAPTLKRQPKRVVIGQYKRMLCRDGFKGNRSLRDELQLLVNGAPDIVRLLDAPKLPNVSKQQINPRSHRVTYLELRGMIEDVLQETGYYASNIMSSLPAPSTFYAAAALPSKLSSSNTNIMPQSSSASALPIKNLPMPHLLGSSSGPTLLSHTNNGSHAHPNHHSSSPSTPPDSSSPRARRDSLTGQRPSKPPGVPPRDGRTRSPVPGRSITPPTPPAMDSPPRNSSSRRGSTSRNSPLPSIITSGGGSENQSHSPVPPSTKQTPIGFLPDS